MRQLKYSILLLFVAALFASCEKEYEDNISGVTPAPQMELIGDNPLVIFKGTPYEDPGIHAIEIIGGDTTELDYEIINEVNVEIPGSYKLFYKVVNAENIPFYLNRRVNVVSFTGYDVIELASGTYDGIRINRGTGGPVNITKLATGVYQISDLFGGYYEAAYGPVYVSPAILVVDENGNIRTELGTSVWGPIVGTGFTFDAENNVITYKVVFDDGFSFDVQLTLQ